MDYKKYIAEKIKVGGVSAEEIASSIALPPNSQMGDYALPCFRFAKVLRKSPAVIAEELAKTIPADGVISEVSAVNGYLNFKINKAVSRVKCLRRFLKRAKNTVRPTLARAGPSA